MKLRERMKQIGYDKIILALVAGMILISFSWPFGKSTTGSEKEDTDNGNNTSNHQGSLFGSGQQEALEEHEQVAEQIVTSSEQYRITLENQLKNLLEKMSGVGQVEVMVTLKGTGQLVLQEDRVYGNEYDISSGSSSLTHSEGNYSTVIINDEEGGETPVVIQTYNPKVEGVVVVAQGAESAVIKSEITDAVMVLFGIESHKIRVVTMSEVE